MIQCSENRIQSTKFCVKYVCIIKKKVNNNDDEINKKNTKRILITVNSLKPKCSVHFTINYL